MIRMFEQGKDVNILWQQKSPVCPDFLIYHLTCLSVISLNILQLFSLFIFHDILRILFNPSKFSAAFWSPTVIIGMDRLINPSLFRFCPGIICNKTSIIEIHFLNNHNMTLLFSCNTLETERWYFPVPDVSEASTVKEIHYLISLIHLHITAR